MFESLNMFLDRNTLMYSLAFSDILGSFIDYFVIRMNKSVILVGWPIMHDPEGVTDETLRSVAGVEPPDRLAVLMPECDSTVSVVILRCWF